MTTSTSVERRRLLARRALLSLSTILCSGVGLAPLAPAFAQQAGLTSGDALATPSYNPIDANGVDLLSGRLTLRSPVLSMGGSGSPSTFFFTWTGQLWMPNTPHLWLDKNRNWRIIIEHDGVSEEFGDAVATNSNVYGHNYRYTQKSPNSGSILTCSFVGAASGGDSWLDYCAYGDGGRKGVSISFFGNTPYNGGYPTDTMHDYDQFGNALVWPSTMNQAGVGATNYLSNGTYTRQVSDGGSLLVDYPNGVSVAKREAYWNPTVTIAMTNKAVAGSSQLMVFRTANLDGKDKSKSYLRPKSTTQTITTCLAARQATRLMEAGT